MCSDLETKRVQASNLREQGKFQEAVALYHDLWENSRDSLNEWDGWRYADCLRKLDRSQEALVICREVWQMNPDFKIGNTLYAWCIYDLSIKNADFSALDEAQFFKGANAIVSLVEQNQYSPYVRSVFKVLDYLNSKRNTGVELDIDTWLNRLDPKQLSAAEFRYTDPEGVLKALPSDKERWYGFKTRVLERLERYDECIELCQKALLEIPNFHYDNDIWFRWRIAVCHAKQGKVRMAVEEMNQVLKLRKEWFMQFELAKLYLELGNANSSLQYAIDAALATGEPKFKGELFYFLGTLLQSQGQQKPADQHFLLAAKLRRENGWPLSQELDERLKERKLDLGDAPSSTSIQSDLATYWEEARLSRAQRYEGSVKQLLGDGRSGLITGTNCGEYYFRSQSFGGPAEKLRPGLAVTFCLEPGYDRKKGEESLEATYIRAKV